MQRRLENRDAIILQHVQQRRFARVVETKEKHLRMLVRQAQRGEDVPEPVKNPHRVQEEMVCL
jgi:hypothetical protein